MIKITTEKIVVEGEKRRRIIDIEGVMPLSELPDEYVNGVPRVIRQQKCGNHKDICVEKYDGFNIVESRLLNVGQDYDEVEFQIILQIIYNAGERLHKIRQGEKELKKTWNGKEVFHA